MNTKNNLSFRNNEEKIQNALLQLLEENDIDNITVKQICAVSNINRSTFYSHYDDILSLIHAIENRIHQEIISDYQNKAEAGIGMLDGSFYHNFLTNIKKYKTFYKASLKKRTTFPLTEGYEEIMNHLVIPACTRSRTAIRNTGTTVTVYAAVTLGGLYQLTTGFNFPDICLQFMAGQSTIVTDNQA